MSSQWGIMLKTNPFNLSGLSAVAREEDVQDPSDRLPAEGGGGGADETEQRGGARPQEGGPGGGEREEGGGGTVRQGLGLLDTGLHLQRLPLHARLLDGHHHERYRGHTALNVLRIS
jgi:hypothetical protein